MQKTFISSVRHFFSFFSFSNHFFNLWEFSLLQQLLFLALPQISFSLFFLYNFFLLTDSSQCARIVCQSARRGILRNLPWENACLPVMVCNMVKIVEDKAFMAVTIQSSTRSTACWCACGGQASKSDFKSVATVDASICRWHTTEIFLYSCNQLYVQHL